MSSADNPLFRLPAELRNAIYEYALVDEVGIKVHANLAEPALLATCHQVGEEAYLIWYCENEFEVPVHDCKATIYKQLLNHHGRVTEDDISSITFVITGRRDWQNLLQWCKMLRAGEPIGIETMSHSTLESYPNKARKTLTVIRAAHKIARSAKTQKECDQELSELRFLVGQWDEEWLE